MKTLVTGAASGIGLAIVNELIRRGDSVLALDISAAGLDAARLTQHWPGDRVTCRSHDVRDAASWQSVINEAATVGGHIDVLINCAGVVRPEFVDELTADAIDLQVDVNLKGVLLGTRAAAAFMAGNGGGHIVNIASMAALTPVPGIAVYSATKHAVRAFTLAAARELEDRGVHLSVVCPDAVATPMVDYQVDFPQAAMTFSGTRVLTAEEVAAAVIRRALVERRLEIILPWSRGMIARSTNWMPRWLLRRLSKSFVARGRAEQIRRLAQRG